MHERRGDRAEDEQERALEPATDPRQLEERRRKDDDGRLNDDVAVSDVCQLVRKHGLQLRRRRRRQKTGAHTQNRAADAATRRERPRQPVVEQVELRLRDTGNRSQPLDRRVQRRRFADRKLTCADEADDHPVAVPVERACQQRPAEDEDREQPVAAEGPTEQSENRARADQQRPRFQDVANDEEAPGTNCRPLARASAVLS